MTIQVVLGGTLPGGGADIWTFVTYALIHADWTHFGVNAVWLLPFGSAVARRFGTRAFLPFSPSRRRLARIASRHASWRTVPDDRCIGGDLRHHGRGDALRIPARWAARAVSRRRRSRLSRAGNTADGVLRDPRVLLFLVVWFGINILFGLGSFPVTGSEQPVAWQAHIGGFLAGLLLFSWFDRSPDLPQLEDTAATPH
jgi:membrane associated rhomboid family serine protease